TGRTTRTDLGLPPIRRVRLGRREKAVEPQQPGYLSHREAAAAPVDRLTQRQTLLVGHRPQRLPSALLSVRTRASRSPSAVSTATARPSIRRSRSARSLRSTAWASNAERRAACLTDC